MNNVKIALLAMATTACLAGLAQAKAPASEASKLGMSGTDMSPVGAERAANAAGTIPAWDGGITKPPASFKAGGFQTDPFPSEKPEFTITASNYKDYGDKISAGQIAMFKKYANWKMPVYPTHRTASLPKSVYDSSMKNAATGTLEAGGDGVLNVTSGIPFPILSADASAAGAEAIWNHKLKFKGETLQRWANQAMPTASGQYSLVRIKEESMSPFYRQGATLADINNVLIYFYQEVTAPPRFAGQILLVHETLNSKQSLRQAWVYNPGQRRVRRAPDVAYDNPGTASDNLRTSDMLDMFNGAMDRYNWKLVGKREMYVPYNSYKAHASTTKVANLVTPNFINPDMLRYELHRVYVVEATLKPGQSHINPRRTFYLDEDSWQILTTDHYDTDGKLWRYSDAPTINYYDRPTTWSTLETHHDLKNGRYVTSGLDNQETPYNFGTKLTSDNFAPQSLRQRGIQ